jgi:hypothetical protein
MSGWWKPASLEKKGWKGRARRYISSRYNLPSMRGGGGGKGGGACLTAPTRHFLVLRRVWFFKIKNIVFEAYPLLAPKCRVGAGPLVRHM